MTKVVDTNVAMIANGRDIHASDDCRILAIELLVNLVESGRVVIDDAGAILAEYGRRLHPRGQPGVGDRFYRYLLDNQGNSRRVRAVSTAQPRGEALRAAFERGALSTFDHSDRVFALCAAVGRAPVATATDSDWVQHEAGLAACGVQVEYVCGRAAAAGDRADD
jgi:hypothetical protein